jgi:hypothetical protein
MPEATAGADGQEPTASAPQDGTSGQPQAGAEDGSSSTEGITDVKALQQELSKARAQTAKHRAEAKAFKDAEAEKEKAALTESERLNRRLSELEARAKELEAKARAKTLEAAVAKQAVVLGIIDPDAAVKLLDAEDLEVDEETGEPTNVEAALKALIKAKPYLVQKPEKQTSGSINGAAGAEGGPAPKLTADELAAAQAAGMTPERYAALKGVKTLADWQKTQPARQ